MLKPFNKGEAKISFAQVGEPIKQAMGQNHAVYVKILSSAAMFLLRKYSSIGLLKMNFLKKQAYYIKALIQILQK